MRTHWVIGMVSGMAHLDSLYMKDLQILAKIDSRCKTNKARGI